MLYRLRALSAIFLAVALFPACAIAQRDAATPAAQQGTSTTPGPHYQFEAASIHVVDPHSQVNHNDPDDASNKPKISTGTYDIELKVAPAEGPLSEDPRFAGLASIFTAVQEQFGLKLLPEKVPGNYLLIDHVDKIPTEISAHRATKPSNYDYRQSSLRPSVSARSSCVA